MFINFKYFSNIWNSNVFVLTSQFRNDRIAYYLYNNMLQVFHIKEMNILLHLMYLSYINFILFGILHPVCYVQYVARLGLVCVFISSSGRKCLLCVDRIREKAGYMWQSSPQWTLTPYSLNSVVSCMFARNVIPHCVFPSL